jgi:MFS family permease
LWLASVLSAVGSEISRIGVLLFLVEEAASPVSLALYVFVRVVPGMLLAPIVGAFIDRFDRRSMMIVADLIRLACVGGMIAAPTIPVIYGLSFVLAIGTTLFEPAKLAAIPQIVPSQELTEANALDRSSAGGVLVVGPVAGAALFAAFGLEMTLLVDAATFVLSAGFVALIQLPRQAQTQTEDQTSGYVLIVEGFRYIADHPLTSYLVAMTFLSVLCVGVWVPLAPFFIRDYLGASEEMLGWAIGSFGLGSILGGLLSPLLSKRFGNGRLVFGTLFVEAIVLFAYACTPSFGGSLAILLGWGALVTVMMVTMHSILQQRVPGEMLGRIFASLRQVEDLAMVFAMGAVILMRDTIAPDRVFAILGLLYLLIVVATAGTRGSKMLRNTP